METEVVTYVECKHCEMDIICRNDGDIDIHEGACSKAPITVGDFEATRQKVDEMHAMLSQLAGVMTQMKDHPMLAAFMPKR